MEKTNITKEDIKTVIKDCITLCERLANANLDDRNKQMIEELHKEAKTNLIEADGLMESNSALLGEWYRIWKGNEEWLIGMENNLGNNNNNNNTNNNPFSGIDYDDYEEDLFMKEAVIDSINEFIKKANAKKQKLGKNDENAFYLKSMLNGARKDLIEVKGLNDNDPLLETFLSKYAALNDRVDDMQVSSRDEEAPTAFNGLGGGLPFETSRSGVRVEKKQVVNLISDCKSQLWQLNEDNLIALEDLEQWEDFYTQVCTDYTEVIEIDPRDKTKLSAFMRKYTLIEKDIKRLVKDCMSNSNDTSKSKGANTEAITKESVSKKLNAALNKIDEIFDNGKPTRKEANELNNLANNIEDTLNDIASMDEYRDARDLRAYDREADKINTYLDNILLTQRHKVKGIINGKDASRRTKESGSGILKKLAIGGGITAAAIAILYAAYLASQTFTFSFGLKNPNNNNNNNNNNFNNSPSTSASVPTFANGIYDIDIEDYDQLIGYATDLQTKLPADSEMTIEDIMYAIRLANFDNLKDKAIFRERDEVVASSYYFGELSKAVGVDALVQRSAGTDIYLSDQEMTDVTMCSTDLTITKEDFDVAKTANGYDIYAVCQYCTDMINSNDSREFEFAKVFNDVVARYCVNFSICEDCPISTYYAIAGMYNANSGKVLELTANDVRGPIYGSGYRIDGTYGNMCVEELEAFMRINHGKGEFVGNPNNALYTYVIDENITNYMASLGK